jgi:hypothetical protein
MPPDLGSDFSLTRFFECQEQILYREKPPAGNKSTDHLPAHEENSLLMVGDCWTPMSMVFYAEMTDGMPALRGAGRNQDYFFMNDNGWARHEQ